MPIVVDTEGNENPMPDSGDTQLSYPEHSEVKPTINELNSFNTESLDGKVHIQKIQDLEDTIRELEQREFEISIPFRELKVKLIRQSNLSGQDEPCLIYLTIDLTSKKSVIYSRKKT